MRETSCCPEDLVDESILQSQNPIAPDVDACCPGEMEFGILFRIKRHFTINSDNQITFCIYIKFILWKKILIRELQFWLDEQLLQCSSGKQTEIRMVI